MVILSERRVSYFPVDEILHSVQDDKKAGFEMAYNLIYLNQDDSLLADPLVSLVQLSSRCVRFREPGLFMA
jgi:hypothetical protein